MLEERENGIVIKVLVVPNAKKNEIVGIDPMRNRIKVKVKAPPAEGKANKELVMFFSKLLGAKIEILRGERSREKDLFVRDVKAEQVKEKLGL